MTDLPGSILMQRNYVQQANPTGVGPPEEGFKGLRVDRIDLPTMKMTPAEPAAANANSYLTDGRGNVRMMILDQKSGGEELTGKYSVKYRRADSRKWEDFSEDDGNNNGGDYPIAI